MLYLDNAKDISQTMTQDDKYDVWSEVRNSTAVFKG